MPRICLMCDTTDLFYSLRPSKRKLHYGHLIKWLRNIGEVTKAYALGHFPKMEALSGAPSTEFTKYLETVGYEVDFTETAPDLRYLPISSAKIMSHIMSNIRECDLFVLGICNKGFGELLDTLTKECIEYKLLTLPGAGIADHPLARDRTLLVTNEMTFPFRARPNAKNT